MHDTVDVSGLRCQRAKAGRSRRVARPYHAGPTRRAPHPGLRPSRPAAAEAPFPLIDRERELGELRASFEATLRGSGRLVLLGGEPGIGKTRLASVLAGEAAARGARVLWGDAWEEGSAPAFWPWSTALRRWIDRFGSEAVEAAAGGRGAELAHVFPVLRDRLPEGLATPARASDPGRFGAFDAASRFLTALARPAGLVVVLDDFHAADQASLELLELLADDVADARLLVVATYRDNEVGREHPFFGTLSRLTRSRCARRVLLEGIPKAYTRQWVELAGVPGDAAAITEVVHHATNGNPFFLHEVLRHLARERGLGEPSGAYPVPQSVREVIGHRLDRLGDDCRATLRVAALLDGAFDASLLDRVRDDRGGAAGHLDRALGDRILAESEETSGRYLFAHGLIRRVLAEDLPASERAGWHGRIARVLERTSAGSVAETAALVRHFSAAGTPEALRKAFDHACRGGERAARILEWAEAARLYEVALDIGARCDALDAELALDVRLELARALRGAGDIPAARGRCEEVLTACRHAPRPVQLARAALIHVGPIPEFGRVSPAERAVLEEACRVAASIDDGLRARLCARLAADLIAANETAQAGRVIALCEEAEDAARRSGDDGALALALFAAHYARALRLYPRAETSDRDTRPAPGLQEILEAAERGGEYEIAAGIRHLRAMGCFAIGDADAFSAEVDGLATAAAGSRAPEALCLGEGLAAMRAIVQGRFAEAQDRMERELAIARRMQLPNTDGRAMSQRIVLHLVRGRLAQIADEIPAFVDEQPGGNGWQPVRALARLARGDSVSARNDLRTLLAAGFGPAERGVMSRCYLAGLAILCLELGDRESAPELYERIAQRREPWSVDSVFTLGPWALLLGGLARLCARPADAVRHLEDALEAARRMRALPFIAAAQALLVETRFEIDPRARRDARIAAMLEEAEQTARELGLDHVTARIERLRALPALPPETSSGAGALRCEGEFWTVRFAGRELRLRDGKGPRYLAALLAAPERELHVLELAGGNPTPHTAPSADGLSVGALGGAIEDAPDGRASREYRARLDDLRAELEEAEGNCDSARAERIRAELDHLVAQLAQRFGSHARSRSPAETARKAVTKVLRTQIERILEVHPALGEHLRDAIRTGTFCSYAPRTPTAWEIVPAGVAP